MTMEPTPHRDLEALAQRVREHIIRMSGRGGCFIGASLSCADLLVYLYSEVLDIAPDRLHDLGRDYLLLSKGHDVPALYGTLAELGYLDVARLDKHTSTEDHIYWHPNRAIPGVEFHSGSLGHLLSVGMGIAMDIKLRGGANRVFVVLGDGELNEGSVWEALLVARAKQLDNLVVLVDRNWFQANIRTEELIPLEPLVDRFLGFGFEVHRFDGHSFPAMAEAFGRLGSGACQVFIADTVRGKGLPSIEERADRWFVKFEPGEVEALIAELRGGAQATLTSDTLIVR
jgi:transketolase